MFNQENCTMDQFLEFMGDVVDRYPQLKHLSPKVIQEDYEILKKFTIEQIYSAYNMHRQNPDFGMYPPTPAHIMKYFQEPKINTDEIIAAARLKNTPLGILAAIHIGSHDLDTRDANYLRQRAQEVIQLMPELKNKFNQNKLTQHEQNTMKKYGVNIESHFQKLGESKNAEVIKLESTKPNLRLASSINALVSDKRAN